MSAPSLPPEAAPAAVTAGPGGAWATGAAGVLGLLASGAAMAGAPVTPGVLVGLGTALGTGLALGVAWQGSGVFARPLLSVRTDRTELALTFDDGPDPRGTPEVLDVLEAHGQRATFFVIGERAEAHRALLAEIVRRGHALGNHTWAHGYLTNLVSPARLEKALRRTNALIEDLTGQRVRWMRAPVGLLSPRIAQAARRAQLQLVGWTGSARDGVAGRSVEDATARLGRHLRKGAILTLHDGALGRARPIAPAVLRALLPRLGPMRSVTLDALLAPGAPSAAATDP